MLAWLLLTKVPDLAGSAALSAAERAAAELEEFARTAHADVDPHAPPAMKASPSVSGGGDPGAC